MARRLMFTLLAAGIAQSPAKAAPERAPDTNAPRAAALFDRYCLETGGQRARIIALSKSDGLESAGARNGHPVWHGGDSTMIASQEDGRCVVVSRGASAASILEALQARRRLVVIGDDTKSGTVFTGIRVPEHPNNKHEVVVVDVRPLDQEHVALVRAEDGTHARLAKDGGLEKLRKQIDTKEAYDAKPGPTLDAALAAFARYCLLIPQKNLRKAANTDGLEAMTYKDLPGWLLARDLVLLAEKDGSCRVMAVGTFPQREDYNLGSRVKQMEISRSQSQNHDGLELLSAVVPLSEAGKPGKLTIIRVDLNAKVTGLTRLNDEEVKMIVGDLEEKTRQRILGDR